MAIRQIFKRNQITQKLTSTGHHTVVYNEQSQYAFSAKKSSINTDVQPSTSNIEINGLIDVHKNDRKIEYDTQHQTTNTELHAPDFGEAHT